MNLSPAAQAVMKAAASAYWEEEYEVAPPVVIAAAALRAVADQVVPHMEEPDWGAHDRMSCDIELYTDHQRKRAQILAIAAELAPQQEVDNEAH